MTETGRPDPDPPGDGRRDRPDHGHWFAVPPPWWPADEPWPPSGDPPWRYGPPWRWAGRGPWPRRRGRPWRGFGCLFGILFLAGVLGLLAFAASVMGGIIGAAGPFGTFVRVAAVVVGVAIVLGLTRAGGGMRRSSSVLDQMSEVAARVEAGDYSARVGASAGTPGAVRDLARRFDTMVARLEADERQRRRLLADVTHELRTPLAVVQGSVEAILDGVHPPDEAHLATILEETRVLGRLIDDLRTLALSEAGSLSLHREPTDLAILTAEVATAFAAAAQAGVITIQTAVDERVPLVDVDPVRIREVLTNLVANALRHTPAGGRVAIAAKVAGDRVEMTVRDTGSGISADLLPHVFDRFTRGEGSTGTGLGLAIARGLVELHGGTISATTALGGGTEILVRLPIDAE